MAKIEVTKTKDDLVRIINISEKISQEQYDGVAYPVQPGKEILVKRYVAEHLKRKSFGYETKKYALEIKENPFPQHSVEQMPAIMEESAKLKATVDGLIKEIEAKDKQIALLEKEIDETRAGKREDKQEPKKPGRPKGS